MGIIGTGIDALEVSRIQLGLDLAGPDYLGHCFTSQEIEQCEGGADHPGLAARFAAKEAAMKALGTGWGGGVGFRSFEVLVGDSGRPMLTLHGKAREVAEREGIHMCHVSYSHTDDLAVAQVVMEGNPHPVRG
jgi:holo-[acyl-carrier protein] synthase